MKNFPAITHVGCILQARRKFLETSKATKKVGSAEEEIGDIRKLCAIEAVLREKLGIERISGTRFQILRSERCTPILEISTA